MAHIKKAKLRSKIVKEIEAECKIRNPETKVKLETEVELLVDILFSIVKKFISGDLSERNTIILYKSEIEMWGFNLLKEKEFANLDIGRLKESIIQSLIPPNVASRGGGTVDL